MKSSERVKLAQIVERDGKLYSYRETVVCETEEIRNQYDIDYVVDKLKDGFYGGAIAHGLKLESILNNKRKNVQPTKRGLRKA